MTARFGLLFKRYIQIEKNQWRRVLFEAIVMVIIMILIQGNPIAHTKQLLFPRADTDREHVVVAHKLNDLDILSNMVDKKRDKIKYYLAYAPKSEITEMLTEGVAKKLGMLGVLGYTSNEDMQKQFDERTTLAGIVFHDSPKTEAPKSLSISIRFPSEFRTIKPFLTEDRLWLTRCTGAVREKRDNAKDSDTKQDLYIREGFLQVQHHIFLQWYHQLVKKYPNKYTEPQVEVFNIRLKAATEPCAMMTLVRMPAFLYNFIFLLPFLNIIRNIAGQLEDGVMVHQWHYGFSFCTQYSCLFLVLMLRLMVTGLGALLVLIIFWVMEDGEYTVEAMAGAILFIFIYYIELILTAMVVAKLFANPINGVLFGLVMWLFSYSAFGIILDRYWDVHSYYVAFILVSFFNTQFSFCMQLFHHVIDYPRDLTYYDFTVLYASAACCLIIYLLVFFLVQWRCPGRLLSRRVLRNKPRVETQRSEGAMYVGRSPSWQNFEFVDAGSEEMMRLKHVSTSHHDSEQKILKNVSLRVYKGEILAILGHIGSGKLTLLRLMAGLKFPLRGSVSVLGNGYTPKGTTRHLVDFRFDEHGLSRHLTVQQTIEYHVRLKLRREDEDRFKIEKRKWLTLLDQHIESRGTKIGQLSYASRRLVALCCCLAGNTQLVILEEPTLKLTGGEAQSFWAIINQEKETRAIVVATYSVGEAEHVADRVAILNLGVLEASGTSFFLRSKFIGMLDMVVTKKPHVPAEPITDFINQFLSHVQPDNEIGDTLTYRIPLSSRPRLQKLCLHLESDRNRLGIDYFRIVSTELADTYMKLVKSFRLQKQIIPDVTQTFKYQVVSEKQLRRQRIRAMFYKKMIHSAPNIWPIIMIFTSFILIAVIAKMSVMLDVPKVRSNVIQIGFTAAADVNNMPDIKGCGYVDIHSLTKTHHYKRQGNMMSSFTKNSFKCEKGRYRDDLKKVNELKSLGAVEQDGDQIMNGYITQDIFHSAPMMLNLLHNEMLKLAYPDDKEHFALVTNHPLPTPLSMKINLIDNKIAHMNAPLALGCILPLAVSVFIIPIVEEQISQLRILQIIAGLGMPIYWGVNIFWDLFTYLIYSVIIVVIMAVMGIGGFGSYENFLILVLMCLYGLAALTHTYVLSFYVNTSRIRAFLSSLLLHGLTGIVLYIFYWDVANSNEIFFYGACLFPGFSMLDGISNIYTQCLEEMLCQDKCEKTPSCTLENMQEMVPNCEFHSYFTWSSPGIMPAIVYMVVSSLLGGLLIFWIELHRREKKYHSSRDLRDLRTATYPFDDADMADVKLKIAESDMTKCKQSVFLVDQVEAKVPMTGTRLNTVSFALNKYMSMGIYGRRNSGKSHLVRQLVGIDGFAFGEIYVRGLDLKLDTDKIRTYMGYCPQHAGLLMELTPREHIRLLCMIRGVPEPKISEKMRDLCLMLNMTGWMHRKCGNLTAEKLRKLNVALALVAHNKILVLDEPTCGLPGTTRDEIWNILRYIRHCGKTVIFATNDELECKKLGDFIILLHDSEMVSLGSLQYLRYKYSTGFYLEVRLIRDGKTVAETMEHLRKDMENLARFVNFLHDKSVLVSHTNHWLKYYVPVGDIVYSYLYGSLEKNKMRLNIQDYCIYQADVNSVVEQVHEMRAELKRRIGSNGQLHRFTNPSDKAKGNK
ncbi:ABC transporter A family member 2 [Drosophila guanche]|uniref:Blast:ATP-binding cassette sub-family A member 3 n=1 Tax=Drosophila guanche TaxID=7266 RepID=A0A3B0J8A3_DROGU|nr:ABC transporter A family member 2 [Drosophila guanche]SPP78075.1 blast:ATP-binding cassette sub-family A member 3 [Drosophila guanche]